MSRRTREGREKQASYLPMAAAFLLGSAAFLAPLVGGKLEPYDMAVYGPAVLRILVFSAALVFLVHGKRVGWVKVPAKVLAIECAIFFACAAQSLISTASVRHSFIGVTDLVACILLTFMAASYASKPRVLYAILGALLASTVVVSALGLKEYILSVGMSPDWRIFGTFFNPDFLAGFMVLILPVSVAWYMSETSLGISVASGLSVLGALSSLLLTGSRFGAVAMLLGLMVFALFALASRSMRKQQVIRLVLLIIPVLIVLFTCSRPFLNRVASVQSESHSGGFRIATWEGTIRMITAHPIRGTGLGTFELTYPKYAVVGVTKLAHNSYLQLASETGVETTLALVALLATAAMGLIRFLGHKRNDPSQAEEREPWMPDRGLMISGILGGATASAARNLVDSDWYISAIAMSFAVVAGIGMALSSQGELPRISVRRSDMWVSVLFLNLVILTSLASMGARSYASLGNTYIADGDPAKAISAFVTAIRMDTLNADHRRALSRAYAFESAASGDRDQLRRAESWLRRAIEQEPSSARSHYQLGQLYAYMQSDSRAVYAYKRALARDPHSLPTLLALAQAFERMGRKNEALDAYRRMVRIENSPYEQIKAMPELVEPSYVFAHYALGKDFEARDDTAGAAVEYRSALARVDRFQESMEKMGEILEAGGHRDTRLEEEIEEAALDMETRLMLMHYPQSRDKHPQSHD